MCKIPATSKLKRTFPGQPTKHAGPVLPPLYMITGIISYIPSVTVSHRNSHVLNVHIKSTLLGHMAHYHLSWCNYLHSSSYWLIIQPIYIHTCMFGVMHFCIIQLIQQCTICFLIMFIAVTIVVYFLIMCRSCINCYSTNWLLSWIIIERYWCWPVNW